MPRPRVFFDFSVQTEEIGRVIFELFTESAPKTCENFRALCTGEKGLSTSGKPLYYKNTVIHRSIKDFMLQGGDIVKGNGTGGESIYGGNFADEDLTQPIDAEGLLCMANKGPDSNGSQYFITLRDCSHLNGKHVVFGRVIKGYQEVVMRLAEISVDDKNRPVIPIVVSNCGELELRKGNDQKSNTVESAGSRRRRHRSNSSDSDRRQRKAKSRRKETPPEVVEMPPKETEEEYDARLEREEAERLEIERKQLLEKVTASYKLQQEQNTGLRLKGRGRMKFIDPEIGRKNKQGGRKA